MRQRESQGEPVPDYIDIEIKLMMFSLDMVDYPMYYLSSFTWNFLCWMGLGDHSKSVLLFGFFLWGPSFMLKSWGVVVVGGSGGLQDFYLSSDCYIYITCIAFYMNSYQ